MKVINLAFDPTLTGPAALTNSVITGDVTQNTSIDYVILNNHNVGAFVTCQTIFTGEVPVYNVEVNLGMIDRSVNYGNKMGQMVIDPNGWDQIPASILSPDSQIGLPFYFSAPFFAIRLNIKTAGTGTAVFKVLQQGII